MQYFYSFNLGFGALLSQQHAVRDKCFLENEVERQIDREEFHIG